MGWPERRDVISTASGEQCGSEWAGERKQVSRERCEQQGIGQERVGKDKERGGGKGRAVSVSFGRTDTGLHQRKWCPTGRNEHVIMAAMTAVGVSTKRKE